MMPWWAESKHVVAHVSIYNQSLGGKKKKKAKQKASAVTQNCQMTVALRPKTGGNYTRGEKKPAGRSDQPQIIYPYSQSSD